MSKRRKNSKKEKSSGLKKLVFVIGFLAITYGLGCTYFARGYIYPARKPSGPAPKEYAEKTMQAGEFEMPTWMTPGLAGGKPRSSVVFLFVHGYKSNRAAFTNELEDVMKAGYEAVAPALPGHDSNVEEGTAFAVKEADRIVDLAKSIRTLAKTKVKIVAVGQSMGGATVWLASEKDPAAFDAVVTDGAFANLNEAADSWLEHEFTGGKYVLKPVISIASLMSGVNPDEVRPEDAAARWKGKPTLIIHGGADDLIDRTHAERLVAASGGTLFEVPGAEHVKGYDVARKAYLGKLVALARSLSVTPRTGTKIVSTGTKTR